MAGTVTQSVDLDAGPNQTIVVYVPPDTGTELDPEAIWSNVAIDASSRAMGGWHIVSTTAMPLRHSGTAFTPGSGFETKVSVVVDASRRPARTRGFIRQHATRGLRR
jgi:hypothetical protein